MFSQLNQDLERTRDRVRTSEKLRAMLREVRSQQQNLQARVDSLAQKVDAEQADVRKLEGMSLTAVFYSVLGTKSDQLEKEKQEFLAAKLKLEDATQLLDSSKAEERRLRSELEQFAGVDDELAALLSEKEEFLRNSSDANAELLLQYSEQIADLNSDHRELGEALAVGREALNTLKLVESDLNSAANWGAWDMLGGGMLVTMAKHSKIDSAKQHAQAAQEKLLRFQEELADANQRLQISLELGGLTAFGDLFFDGLITDWVVQSKISNAKTACASAISETEEALYECDRLMKLARQQIDELTQERQQFIESA